MAVNRIKSGLGSAKLQSLTPLPGVPPTGPSGRRSALGRSAGLPIPFGDPVAGVGSPAETATTWLHEARRAAAWTAGIRPHTRRPQSTANRAGNIVGNMDGKHLHELAGSGAVREHETSHVPTFPTTTTTADGSDCSRIRSGAQRAFWHLVLSGPDTLDSVQAGLDSPNADVRRWSTKAMDHLVDASGLATLGTVDDPDPGVAGSRLATPLLVIDARTTDAGLTRPPCSHEPSQSCSTIPTHMFAATPSSSWGAGYTRTPRPKRPSSAPTITTRRRPFGKSQLVPHPADAIHRKTSPAGSKRTTATR